jgi:GAF domain-containing protein
VVDDIVRQIAETVRTLYDQSSGDTGAVLDGIAKYAADEIPGAQYASITATIGQQVETGAATGPYASIVDRIQEQLTEGPCLTAAIDRHTVFVDDIAVDRRWPAYRREVMASTPIRSIMSFRLVTHDRSMGALNVYSEQPHAFDDDARELGLIFATHAALVWDAARRDDQFRSALASRDIIGQAKGMLMERFDLDSVAAFELLRRLSQQTNTPLREVARRVVARRLVETTGMFDR